MSILDADEWRERKIRLWLLGIVCFAVTLDETDRDSVLAMAQELDGLGHLPGRTGFHFFVRTSIAACNAIADRSDPGRNVILRRLVGSITDSLLRAVVTAAVTIDATYPSAPQEKKRVLA